MFINTVYYNRFSSNLNKTVSGTTTLKRDKPLTLAGAQRILRARKTYNASDRRGWETAVVTDIVTSEE